MEGFKVKIMEDISLYVEKSEISPIELEVINGIVKSGTKYQQTSNVDNVIKSVGRPKKVVAKKSNHVILTPREKKEIIEKHNGSVPDIARELGMSYPAAYQMKKYYYDVTLPKMEGESGENKID